MRVPPHIALLVSHLLLFPTASAQSLEPQCKARSLTEAAIFLGRQHGGRGAEAG
jgi:hypothetical protein